MQLKNISMAIFLALLSGIVTGQSQPGLNPMPTETPSQSASPSSHTTAPASRSATPTVSATTSSFNGSSTPASSIHGSSTPASSSGFSTSAIPAASGEGNSNILGDLLHLSQK